MSDLNAKAIAQVLGGKPIQTEDQGWLVVIERPDGRIVTPVGDLGRRILG